MSVLARLERAFTYNQPVMFDVHEVMELMDILKLKDSMYKMLQGKYDNLSQEALHGAKESVGLMLKATMERSEESRLIVCND